MSFKNEDRLSHLPEGILSHILSSIPTKLAVRTSILSKKWRYKWTLVTNLDFDNDTPVDGLDCLSNFVDRALKLCKTSKIERFRLHFSRCGYRMRSELKSKMSNWINEAVRINVCEVDLDGTPFELPISLFTCKTLTKLSLRELGFENFIGPNVVFILPLLKTLDITVPDDASVNEFRLINSCPMLESLFLGIGMCNGKEDYNFNIPTLKKLKLHIIGYSFTNEVILYNEVILNVPKIEYLCVFGLLCSLFVIKDLTSLVKATVDIVPAQIITNHLNAEFLKGISGAKSLSWCSLTLDVPLNSAVPKFPNLKHLELEGCLSSGWMSLFQFLESSSELEDVCIQHMCVQEKEECCWIEPRSVPGCMISNLKTMKFKKCNGRMSDVRFLKYMLGNAEVLKTLTITRERLPLNEEIRLSEHLHKIPKASKDCEIQFVGNWHHYEE